MQGCSQFTASADAGYCSNQLDIVELHEVHIVSVLKPVKFPLDGILSLQNISCTTHLSVICKLAENALNPLFLSLMKTQSYQCQYRPLRGTTC